MSLCLVENKQPCALCCRYKTCDGELHKDLEGVLEGYCKTLQELLKKTSSMATSPSEEEGRSSGMVFATLLGTHHLCRAGNTVALLQAAYAQI